MEEEPIQILEVRADESPRPVTITLAVSARASRAILVALSEQLDRRRGVPTTSASDALALREHVVLMERFAPLASAGAHAIVQFTDSELRVCLLDLSAYADRVDGEHFQAPELRERLQTIARLTPALWEANAMAAAAGQEAPALATQPPGARAT
jgi:hypothetical protein